MSESLERSRRVITKDTLIPISVGIGAMGLLASGVIWVQGILFEVRSGINDLNRQVRELADREHVTRRDTWTYDDMRSWAERFHLKNPSLQPVDPLRYSLNDRR